MNKLQTGPLKCARASDDVVMVPDVEGEVIDEARPVLRRAPGSPEKAVEVGSHHGAGVIERKERVKPNLFELTLTRDAAAPALHRLVLAVGMNGF